MPFILETIVITQDENGLPNFAPMGVTFEDDEIFLRPYKETTTYTNLVATGQAVIKAAAGALKALRGASGRSTAGERRPGRPIHPRSGGGNGQISAGGGWRPLGRWDPAAGQEASPVSPSP